MKTPTEPRDWLTENMERQKASDDAFVRAHEQWLRTRNAEVAALPAKQPEPAPEQEDVHRRTASDLFGVPYDAVSKYQRNEAKRINFGRNWAAPDAPFAPPASDEAFVRTADQLLTLHVQHSYDTFGVRRDISVVMNTEAIKLALLTMLFKEGYVIDGCAQIELKHDDVRGFHAVANLTEDL